MNGNKKGLFLQVPLFKDAWLKAKIGNQFATETNWITSTFQYLSI